ncbi:MAG TPA: hypothetical protein VK356_12250, partial [Thermomicrobiales bacterium]|nr:hypothetical protein [Thermomicrobiales bacterium]
RVSQVLRATRHNAITSLTVTRGATTPHTRLAQAVPVGAAFPCPRLLSPPPRSNFTPRPAMDDRLQLTGQHACCRNTDLVRRWDNA